MKNNDGFTLYRTLLEHSLNAGKTQDANFVKQSFSETLLQSPAYQSDAMVNGVSQPLVATRKETKKCSVIVVPETSLHIGDLVKVLGEHWLCMELYQDEFGMTNGVLWMCNQKFIYQNHDMETIEKYAILDDGSYSSGSDKAITVTDNRYTCYMSLDKESKSLFVDKRLAISIVYDSKGDEILEVGKIKWMDIKSKNFGEGSHLLMFGVNDDVYNAETDNIKLMICDYKQKDVIISDSSSEEISSYLEIEGKATIRNGSSRTYTAKFFSNKTEINSPEENILGEIEGENNGVTTEQNNTSCRVTVKEDDDLVGNIMIIKCKSESFGEAILEVEVI